MNDPFSMPPKAPRPFTDSPSADTLRPRPRQSGAHMAFLPNQPEPQATEARPVPPPQPTPIDEDLAQRLRRELGIDLPPAQPAAPPPSHPAAVMPSTAAMASPAALSNAPEVPRDFVTETEHPVLPVPFSVQMESGRFAGQGLSITAAHIVVPPGSPAPPVGHREHVRLLLDFHGFGLALPADVVVAPPRGAGEATLQFLDPLGPHLPQLRHVLNSYIAGDLVSLGGLLAYSGPTKPKAAKAPEADSRKLRVRSIAMAALSFAMIVTAAGLLLNRATQAYEIRPVFIERQGQDMRATTAGQVSYLNPQAKAGEVVFSINSNTGDVLNFQLPCDCEVSVTQGIFEGATVLPIDLILTFFDSTVGVRVQTQISIEGLARVMNGDRAYLDMDDGRTVPVGVELTSATNAATQRGDLFVPVDLVPAEGAISTGDIGRIARLRLATPWLPDLRFNSGEES